MRVRQKPYKTQQHDKDNCNALSKRNLCRIAVGVLSGNKTRKRVYLETI